MKRFVKKIRTRVIAASLGLLSLFGSGASAQTPENPSVVRLLTAELLKRNPAARIEITDAIRWEIVPPDLAPASATQISILGEGAQGNVTFVAQTRQGAVRGSTRYSAWKYLWVAARRIQPGEKIDLAALRVQEVDVASGSAYNSRGVLLDQNFKPVGIESRQTLLEGQFVTSNAVQRVHDIKRGEPVKVRITAGGIVLQTTGTADGPAYLDEVVRITTTREKRAFVGKLRGESVVEVAL